MDNQLTCGFAIWEDYKEILKKKPEAVINILNPIKTLFLPPKMAGLQGSDLWKSRVMLLI